jgi:hypothetical protein
VSEDALSTWLGELGEVEGERSEFTIDPAKAFERLNQQHSVEPGLWAVKWVQGAVAAKASEIHFNFTRQRVQVGCYGPLDVDAKALMEMVLGGRIPGDTAQRHWVTALRGLGAGQVGWLSLTTHCGHERTVVVLKDGRLEINQDQRSNTAPLFLAFAPAKSTPIWRSGAAWSDERDALASRLQFCSMPVLVDKKGVSRRSPFESSKVMLSLMEPAEEGQPYFCMYGDPTQILSPSLMEAPNLAHALQRCALMIAVSRSPAAAGKAHVFWMRDGALIGPIEVVGGTGAIGLDIICPGDHPDVDLSEWALRDPSSFFPQELVLKVARRLLAGLDSLTMDLAHREVETRTLFRFGGAAANARLLRAFEGGMLAALRAFSLREELQLAAG